MLSPEQAKTRLAQWRLPEDKNRFADGVKKLPADLRKTAELAFNLVQDSAADHYNYWQRQQDRLEQLRQRLAGLAAQDRAKLFGILAPRLAPALEQTLAVLTTTPYQTGYNRRAFRAPRHPELVREKQADWLTSLASLFGRYQPEVLTPIWLASWGAHLTEGYQSFGYEIGALLAAVLHESTSEADEVFEILRQSLANQHEIGAMGRHITTAMLLANRPEGWELIEKTLLAAQRQEGLRQAILECIDESHPEAFRRMLRLILDHDLIRFSSVTRAVDVWFGHLWAGGSAGIVKKMLAQLVEFLEDPAACDKAVNCDDPEAAFLALWCLAAQDALASEPIATRMLAAKRVELRYVAARHLLNLGLRSSCAALVPSLGDEDLRVATLALEAVNYDGQSDDDPTAKDDDRFERVEQLVSRLPAKPVKLEPLVWPWTEMTIARSGAAASLRWLLGTRPASRLIPHLGVLDPNGRKSVAEMIVQRKPWEPSTRDAVFTLAGDSSETVREVALKALAEVTLDPDEALRLEAFLTRKTGDLRRGVLALLVKQHDVAALASASRLLAAKDVNQRLAGLEIVRLLTEAKRSTGECRRLADEFQAKPPKANSQEQRHLEETFKEKEVRPTLENALGLIDLSQRTKPVAPRNLKTTFVTPATIACLVALDRLIHEHRETEVRYETYSGTQTGLLGNISWGFPGPDLEKPPEGQAQRLPLADIWLNWFRGRGPDCRDKDGFELVRALIWCPHCNAHRFEEFNKWAKGNPARQALARIISGGQSRPKLRYDYLIGEILEWSLFFSPTDATDYLLDAVETTLSLVSKEDLAALGEPRELVKHSRYVFQEDPTDWRSATAFRLWEEATDRLSGLSRRQETAEQTVRRWRLMHWQDEPFAGSRRRRADARLLMTAYAKGAAKLADVADHLLGPRGWQRYYAEGFDLISSLTERRLSDENARWLADHPEIREFAERATARIVDLELGRGDTETAATAPAHCLKAILGIETLRRILAALGKAEFKNVAGWHSGDEKDRRYTLSYLAKVAFPGDGETPEDFVRIMKQAVKEKQFPEERLLQLTFLAPQRAKSIEAYFNWPNMAEGVYWFLAHMSYLGGMTASAGIDDDETSQPTSDESQVSAAPDAGTAASDATQGEATPGEVAAAADKKKMSPWERLVLERTPLTQHERNEGAIDVAWFRRTHKQLGDRRWQMLAQAARYAANAAQAKRARLIGDVLLNKVSRRVLIDGIKKKQLKEYVRLLGLLPLAKGDKRAKDLAERCRLLRDYRRYANQLSGLTKPSALLSFQIGMKNLAQTAGYADPLRLEWSVGAEELKDLAQGPLVVAHNGVSVTLSLDESSSPSLTASKNDKQLKSIPPDVKKDKKVAALVARVAEIKRQASSMRQSLEGAMCRGDQFNGEELQVWCGHALLAPLLSRLVIVGEGILGYPDKGGKALRDCQGKLEPVKPQETLRLAHPHDLLAAGSWHDWQRECFQTERVQPFKQVFRELYILTNQEQQDGAVSHRYDGQQVQHQQALALFGSRGWNTGEGIFKVFHDLGLAAEVYFQSGVLTPLEVEGATLAGVAFRRRDEWKPIDLSLVPPRLFSEVMRDLDLVVSVAHAGGVDPEASASTVEMRSALLRETCALLDLKNVRFKSSHLLIQGELAEYSVHLGSGTVHRMPGGSLCIVPVHSQHRGRLFLPFADDDPRTAEIISKVLLLARDGEIKDVSILEQIRR